MLDLNPTTLQAVAEKAAQDAKDHPRWLAAIARAIVELNDNPYVARNPNGHGIIIGSTSGVAYAANGVCQCTAYTGMLHGKQVHAGRVPCYHRAMARLVRLCDEREAAATQLAEQVIAVVDQTRVARKIAAARTVAYAKAQREMDELFA